MIIMMIIKKTLNEINNYRSNKRKMKKLNHFLLKKLIFFKDI